MYNIKGKNCISGDNLEFRYKLVIFDLDGTLLNTLGDLAAAGNHALERMGYTLHEEEQYKHFVGNGIPKLIERILPHGSSDNDRQTAHTIFTEYYERHKSDRTAPYSGINELLIEMKAHGITAVCCTNKDHKFAAELMEQFFGSCIAETVGAGRGFPKKPDPATVKYLMEKYTQNGQAPLYVGDSGVDMQTALNAEVDCCGVLWGFRGRDELEKFSPKYIVESVAELRSIIFGEPL